jgi:hypothetical protein
VAPCTPDIATGVAFLGVCVRSLHAAVLGIAATIYLVLGLAFIAASAATFFTAYGQIFTPIYAGSGMAAGVVIFDHSAAMTLYRSEGARDLTYA